MKWMIHAVSVQRYCCGIVGRSRVACLRRRLKYVLPGTRMAADLNAGEPRMVRMINFLLASADAVEV